MPLTELCVYCGASAGSDPAFEHDARRLGDAMARRGIGLIYGGGRIGLMGAVADGVLAGGGRVVGVITRQLVDKEVAHTGVADMRVVQTMHERKLEMVRLSGGFVALPGGYGTLDELFEALSWAQLGIHDRPIGVLNTSGFFDGLLRFLRHAQDRKFLRLPLDRALTVRAEPEGLLDAMVAASDQAGRL